MQIDQKGGDNAVLFGQISQVDSISVNNGLWAKGNGILQVKIGSLTGGVVNITPPEEKPKFPQPRPTPVFLLPRRFNLLLGRREKVKVALDALAYDQPVEFHGSTGLGKTVLLRYLVHHPSIASLFPEGVIYHLSVRNQNPSDLLQILFNAFYENDISFKPTDIQIRYALKDKRALVILDNAQLKREEVNSLLNDLPNFTFIFTSQTQQLWGEGHSIKLRGLSVKDSVSLVTRELQRQLDQEESSQAEKLCTALAGHPLRILQAVALVREDKVSLKTIVHQLQSPNSAKNWTQQLLKPLSKRQKLILAVLAVFGGVALGEEQLASITEISEIKPVLETLIKRNLIQVEASRYKLTGTLVKELRRLWDLSPGLDNAIAYFKNWISQQREISQNLIKESDAILQLLESTVEAGRWSDVLYLGKEIEGAIATTGQWDTWNQVLQWLIQASRVTGEKEVEAFALHQMGTRSLCLSEASEAQNYLTQALKLRENLGDTVGANASSHNLGLLKLLPIGNDAPPQSEEKSSSEENSGNGSSKLLSGLKRIVFVGSILVGSVFLGSIILPKISNILNQEPSSKVNEKPPRPPSNLTAQAIDQTEITLNWTDNNSGSSRYIVERSKEDNDSFKKIATTSLGQTSHLDREGLTPNTTYYYRLLATNDAGNSKPSNEVRAATLESSVKISLDKLSLDPTEVIGGNSSQGEIILNTEAPADGVVVELTSSDLETIKIPSNIEISGGKTSNTFPIETNSVNEAQNVTITASYKDIEKNQILTIESQAINLSGIIFDSETVAGGEEIVGTVELDRAALSITSIQLSTDNPNLVKFPSLFPSVTIPAGESSQSFSLKTNPVEESTSVTITASYDESEKSEQITIEPEPISLENLTFDLTEGFEGTVTLNRQAPKDGIEVNLETIPSDLGIIESPIVQIDADQTYGKFNLIRESNKCPYGLKTNSEQRSLASLEAQETAIIIRASYGESEVEDSLLCIQSISETLQ